MKIYCEFGDSFIFNFCESYLARNDVIYFLHRARLHCFIWTIKTKFLNNVCCRTMTMVLKHQELLVKIEENNLKQVSREVASFHSPIKKLSNQYISTQIDGREFMFSSLHFFFIFCRSSSFYFEWEYVQQLRRIVKCVCVISSSIVVSFCSEILMGGSQGLGNRNVYFLSVRNSNVQGNLPHRDGYPWISWNFFLNARSSCRLCCL